VEKRAWLAAVSDMDKRIMELAKTVGVLGAKLRLTVQNTIDRKSGILSEKPPEAAVVAHRSSLLGGRRLDS
jgi:hypothetical protein